MNTRSLTRNTIKELQYFSSFSAWMLEHKLDELIDIQIRFSKEYDLPLLRLLSGLPENEIRKIARESVQQFLEMMSESRAEEYVRINIEKWVNNQLPQIDKFSITAEDINLLTFIRKKSFLHFIPQYCTDPTEMLDLISEMDMVFMYQDMSSTNVYIDMLRESIHEQAFLLGKVNETIPGDVFIYDFQARKKIYSNNKISYILGYDNSQWKDITPEELIHPDDMDYISQQQEELKEAGDGEIITYKYRARNTGGEFIWLRNFESVLKRKDDGSIWQKIGITLNIDKAQKIASELHKSEERYKQAEAITHLGNYIWYPATNEIEWSDELFRIHGMEPTREKISFDLIRKFNHPDDQDFVKEELQRAFKEKRSFDFHYRVLVGDDIKVLHARGNLVLDQNGNISAVIGTSQDVTEKQNLIRHLREKESVYKQAEELANMGNWKWDVVSNQIEWTDQLYRIYGIEPQSEEITIQKFLSFIHPEDRERIRRTVNGLLTRERHDYTFRIITADNKIRILRSVVQVQKDGQGEPVMVIGSERDITEKQNLIDQLRKSERLYKQAQSLAHVGNWTWDIQANQIHWSDELYRIYGLEPQSEVLTYERYISIIHPDDREKVTSQVQHSYSSGSSWEFTHRLLRGQGEVRFVYATGEVIKDENGQPFMMLGTAQDITERQMLIEKLQESETLYKQAQSLAHIGNWIYDIVNDSFNWSDEMYRIYEVEQDEPFDLERWLSYREPEERESLMAYYHECLKEKKLYDRVEKIVLPDGRFKILHRKGEFICNENGDPVKMIGTTQDITEEYRVQQELKDNQTFIRKITDATPSIITSYNVNTGRYAFISEGVEKLLGYKPNAVMEKGVEFFVSLIHPDDLTELLEKNRLAMEEANHDPDRNDQVSEFTYRMRHRNGQYRWFHTYGTIFDRNNENKVEHVLNITLDVTDQVEASKKIKEQEHFIKQIADASPTILYLYDVEKQSIVYVNREIFFVLGYMPEEILDSKDQITELLYHPEDYHLLPGRQQSGKNFQQVDSMMQYECRMKNKENEWRWLLVREIVFETGANGKIKQILGAALDINRRKEMERTILQNTLQLEQSNASLEEFAYVASHDLKEPLRKISTFGDRLIATQAERLTADGRIYLDKIVDASQRMQTMINDLLAISMITGNTAFEQFSLQTIFTETLQTLEFKIEQLNAVITADELPEASIIPSQFRQLFQNLLSNSLKFVKPGVQPVITVKHQYLSSQQIIHYHLPQAERYHQIVFADNGIGFEMEFANKIFAIFQRLHGRSEYEGSGIGLAICKKIVEHHGGIIYASGEPGVGASFTIILPV